VWESKKRTMSTGSPNGGNTTGDAEEQIIQLLKTRTRKMVPTVRPNEATTTAAATAATTKHQQHQQHQQSSVASTNTNTISTGGKSVPSGTESASQSAVVSRLLHAKESDANNAASGNSNSAALAAAAMTAFADAATTTTTAATNNNNNNNNTGGGGSNAGGKRFAVVSAPSLGASDPATVSTWLVSRASGRLMGFFFVALTACRHHRRLVVIVSTFLSSSVKRKLVAMPRMALPTPVP
jgi:hypothetical protein